jgi:hypothetical protein
LSKKTGGEKATQRDAGCIRKLGLAQFETWLDNVLASSRVTKLAAR